MKFVLLTNKNSKELVEFINEVYNKRKDFGDESKQKFKCEFISRDKNSAEIVDSIWK